MLAAEIHIADRRQGVAEGRQENHVLRLKLRRDDADRVIVGGTSRQRQDKHQEGRAYEKRFHCTPHFCWDALCQRYFEILIKRRPRFKAVLVVVF
jgi:hypothetical protein